LFLRYNITLQTEIRLRKGNRFCDRQIPRPFRSGQLQESGIECAVYKSLPVDICARDPGDRGTLYIHASGESEHVLSVDHNIFKAWLYHYTLSPPSKVEKIPAL